MASDLDRIVFGMPATTCLHVPKELNLHICYSLNILAPYVLNKKNKCISVSKENCKAVQKSEKLIKYFAELSSKTYPPGCSIYAKTTAIWNSDTSSGRWCSLLRPCVCKNGK